MLSMFQGLHNYGVCQLNKFDNYANDVLKNKTCVLFSNIKYQQKEY